MGNAIETYYKGHLFRSRLEARWAALFDLLDWQWTYEPLDANGYLPDFLVHGHSSFIAEVRPCVEEADYVDEAHKVRRGLDGVWGGNTLVLGVDPWHVGGWDQWAAYYLPGGPMDWCGSDKFSDNVTRWVTCRECGFPAIHHASGSYKCMPCGHHDGDHLLGEAPPIKGYWGEAHRLTRWTRA